MEYILTYDSIHPPLATNENYFIQPNVEMENIHPTENRKFFFFKNFRCKIWCKIVTTSRRYQE